MCTLFSCESCVSKLFGFVVYVVKLCSCSFTVRLKSVACLPHTAAVVFCNVTCTLSWYRLCRRRRRPAYRWGFVSSACILHAAAVQFASWLVRRVDHYVTDFLAVRMYNRRPVGWWWSGLLNCPRPSWHGCCCCYWLIITHASIAAGVGRAFSRVCLFVCLSVCALTGKRLELSTLNLVYVYRTVLYGSRAACIDPEVKRSEVKVIWLRKPSRLLVTPAACYGRCQRELHVDTTSHVF